MTSLSISTVTKNFGAAHVLKGVDLVVPDGGFMAILGPSGCGKTTLLRLVAGFDTPDSGTISFGNQVVFGPGVFVPAQRRRVGYVPQEGALFPHLTVGSNITFGLDRRHRKDATVVKRLLELVELDARLAQRYPHQLSGGQQQRVALARALAPEPELVLLDEPFASLDAGLRAGTGRAVAAALRASNATAILVTHDQDEALSLADHVAVMRDGRLAQVGTPQDVYRHPIDPAVAEFVGAAILMPATVDGDSALTSLGRLVLGSPAEAADGEHVMVLIRPEQVRIAVRNATPVETSGRVVDVSYYGHDAAIRLELEHGSIITARVLGEQAPALGTDVALAVEGPVLSFPAS